jgi:hypothetical protein
MPGFNIKTEELDPKVAELLLDKQAEFVKANGGRHYTKQKTINRLIKEAYVDAPAVTVTMDQKGFGKSLAPAGGDERTAM